MSPSPEQEMIVNHTTGPALVQAVAGAGKTRVVVERAKVLPGSVLVVSFSKPAATTLKNRIGKSSVKVATAHSLAFHLMGRPKIDETKFKFIADRIRRDQKRFDLELDELLELITLAKSKLDQTPDASIASLYHAIEDKRLAEGIITFDDLLLQAAHRNMKERIIQFDYVIQDEAQDQNEVQEAFITSCCKGSNYMSVGDPWQTVFEFRGADPSFVSETAFKKRWPGATIFKLSTNYRSCSSIVAAADAISQPRAVAARSEMGVVTFSKHESAVHEAISLANLAATWPVLTRSTAVLYRRHTQSGVIEGALRQASVPFHSVKPFNSLPRVQPLLSYLWLAAGRGTATDVRRSMNKPFRFLPSALAERVGGSPGEKGWVDHVIQFDVPEKMFDWARVVDRLTILHENGMAPKAIVTTLIGALNLTNDQGLLDFASLYVELDDMLDEVGINQGSKGIRLSSIHEAKGMEFDTVFFVGWEKVPVRWDESAGYVPIPEEQRLNYVAFTRAMNTLVVSSVRE